MELLHCTSGPQNLECRVERQKRLEQILFSPEAKVLHYELFGIVERRKDVVEMDNYARSQFGKDLEALIQHVAVHRNHVARVDEQDVVLPQRAEHIKRHFLYRLFNKFRKAPYP